MVRVTLLFEDHEDGLVDFRADYHGGFDCKAKSHNLANQVILFLEREASEKTVKPDSPDPIVLLTDAGIIHR